MFTLTATDLAFISDAVSSQLVWRLTRSAIMGVEQEDVPLLGLMKETALRSNCHLESVVPAIIEAWGQWLYEGRILRLPADDTAQARDVSILTAHPAMHRLVLETVRKLPHVLGPRQSGIPEAEAERLAEILQLHHLMESQGSASGMRPIYHWILTLGNTDFPHHAQFKWTNMALQANFFLNDRVPAAQAEVQRMAVVWASGLGAHQDGQDLGQLLQTTDWAATSWLIRSHYYQELYPQGAKPAAVGGREVSVIDQALKAGRPAMHRLVHAAVDWMATVMNDHPNLEHLAKILRLKSCLELDEASLTAYVRDLFAAAKASKKRVERDVRKSQPVIPVAGRAGPGWQ